MKIAITCESTVDLPQEILKKYNIPVWVMEPLRGGRSYALT